MSWARDNINERDAWARLGMAAEAGWVGEWVGGNLAFGWEVYDAGSGVLAVRSTGSDGTPLYYSRVRPNTARPLLGVDRAGRVLEIPPDSELLDDADAPVAVPNDGTWYTAVASYRVRSREPGTLSITGGSTTITGVGTQFTRYRDGTATAGQPTILRIATDDTGAGNEGSYVIDEIIDDEELTVLVAPPATETGVEFRVKGRFNSGEPADPDIHLNPVVAWDLVTRTTTRPTTALIAYDVRRSGGVCTFIDRRRANMYRRLEGRPRCYNLMPANLVWSNLDATGGGGPGDSTAISAQTYDITVANAQATQQNMIAMSMAPCATGSELSGLAEDQATGLMVAMLWDDSATRKILFKHYTVASGAVLPIYAGNWDDPDNGSTVSITSAGALDVALLAVPAGSGNTHLLFYVDSSGLLQLRTSTDNGATWGSATNIWNPTGAETLSKVSAVLTRMNRIVVAAAYSTGNRIRYIYSDDLGTTWDTNTSAGYSSSATGVAATDVAIVEDDTGSLWTVAAVADTNMVRLYRGQAEGNALANTAEQSAGWKVGPDRGSYSVHSLDAFSMPGGTVGVIYGAGDGTSDRGCIGSLHLARRQILSHRVLVQSPLSANVIFTVPVCVGIDAAGVAHIGWGNHHVVSGPLYTLEARIMQYIPVEVPRALSWWGGS